MKTYFLEQICFQTAMYLKLILFINISDNDLGAGSASLGQTSRLNTETQEM